MTYQEFKMSLLAEVSERAGCDAEVSIRSYHKNNGILLDGITVHESGKSISPTIYLDRYWEEYRSGSGIEEIAEEIMKENREYSIDKEINVEKFLDFDHIRDKVMFRLVNFDMNREFLDTVPMRRALDLAVIYYYKVDREDIPDATCIVRNVDARLWGVTEEELWKLAGVNTPREEPSHIADLYESIREMKEAFFRENEEMVPLFPDEMQEPEFSVMNLAPMHILSNRTKIYGASCILYPEVLRNIAKKLGTDLYILPSSIHEVILMPVNRRFDQNGLSEMVREINECEVPRQEILSDNVYRYYADRDIIML